MRRLMFLALCLAILGSVQAGPALAHGPALKGTEIDRTTPIKAIINGMVAPGKPRREWYTVGLKAGRTQLHVKLNKCGLSMVHIPCTIQLWLMSGNAVVSKAQVVCTSPQKKCGQTATMTYTGKHNGLYYLLVTASGTDQLIYTFRINNIYRLNCKKTC